VVGSGVSLARRVRGVVGGEVVRVPVMRVVRG
jgi:hypothetical protein